ncbi:MAG: 4,5-9,10-diseco-3-hydroxy-5,9,17-trioxoandrosta-1 (10),2-diene-4-oate hydrolase [Ignavibacteriaceae bacterium]|nr:MAG: alpha/beta hydrolase [Chlorobiota bacterium]GJQ31854.1 MAG: 4,5-9,10-diseco-3-hydroxy-5,9,17-trioxoandrosta-1 (10),2-diene-4-oate hydrolase [Ignavibacteriaceae bacterium]
MALEDLKYQFEVKETEIIPGVSIAHTDMGDGDPVVFIHGLGSYIPAWNRNLAVLSRHFRCIAVDLPGYGKSSKPLHSGTMDYYALVIMKLLNNLGIEKFSVCGHSMGGVVALKIALEHAERLNKMILVAPGGAETYSEDEKFLVRSYLNADRIMSNDDEQIANNVKVNFHNFPEEAQFMIDDRIAMRNFDWFADHAEIVARSANGVLNSDVPYRLNEIPIPTLGLFGENDKMIPNRFVHPWLTVGDVIHTFESSILDFQTVLLGECGHFIQFEKPDEFNSVATQFLLN